MTKAGAIFKFWNQFLTAYEENTVPKDAEMPYITYNLVTDTFSGESVSMSASLWYFSDSWKEINSKTEEISEAIGLGGLFLETEKGGSIWLKRGQPFAQNMSDERSDQIRRKLINVVADYLTFD